MLTMLTLDPTTLFYWNLSNNSKTHKFEGSVVSQWAHSIPNNAKPASCASSCASSIGKQSIQSAAPSLTNQSTIMVTSVHTSDIQCPQIHIKPKPRDHYLLDNVAMVGMMMTNFTFMTLPSLIGKKLRVKSIMRL